MLGYRVQLSGRDFKTRITILASINVHGVFVLRNRYFLIQCQKSQQGFTLLELMVVLAIAAIVAFLAAPNFSKNIATRQLDSNAKDTYNLIRSARANALATGKNIYVGNLDADADWTKDLLIWEESNVSGTITYVPANDKKIYGIETEGNPNISVVGLVNNVFGFGADGFVRENNQITITLCDTKAGDNGFTITVLVSGVSALQRITTC